MSDLTWWLRRRRDARTEGPFSTEEIQRLARQRKVGRSAEISSGTSTPWRRLVDTFPYGRPSRPLAALDWLVLTLQSLLAVGLGGLVLRILYGQDMSIGWPLDAWLWAVAGPGLIVASLSSFMGWRRVARSMSGRAELASIIPIAGMIFLVVALAFASLEVRTALVIIPNRVEARSWAANSRIDVVNDRVRILGEIGPDFGARVEASLARVPEPPVIEISSLGGLTVEAMRAARAIQARPGATVIARGRCASACLIVLMAGSHRQADEDLTLQFHAISLEVPTGDRFFKWVSRRAGDDSDRYLEQRGVPQAVIEATNRLGPSHTYPVTAIDALDLGILTDLVDGDQRVPPATARMRWAARSRPDTAPTVGEGE